jgi:hypothetical protein
LNGLSGPDSELQIRADLSGLFLKLFLGFEPALGGDRWPWPSLRVYVLASERPDGTPDDVVTESDPQRLLHRLAVAA